jgi:hypothetical protein
MDEAARNALSLGRDRRGDGGGDDACVQDLRFHTTPLYSSYDIVTRQRTLAFR